MSRFDVRRDMESHLCFNLIYLSFCKFSLSDQVPDYSSICRWRNRFLEFNVFEKAFDEVNNQLSDLGLELNNAIIVDAGITKSQARPRKKETIDIEPTGDMNVNEQPQITLTSEESKDPDARWIKKGKRSTYGYKIHASVNKEGLFNALITTPANIYDGNMLADIVNKVKPKDRTELYADKGYDSKSNRDFLAEMNIVDNIMRKKNINQISEEVRVSRNKSISKIRYVVERSFGGLKSKTNLGRSKYLGLRKTHNFNILGALVYNLVRSTNLL